MVDPPSDAELSDQGFTQMTPDLMRPGDEVFYVETFLEFASGPWGTTIVTRVREGDYGYIISTTTRGDVECDELEPCWVRRKG